MMVSLSKLSLESGYVTAPFFTTELLDVLTKKNVKLYYRSLVGIFHLIKNLSL